MASILTLTDLKANDTARRFKLGTVAAILDATYGPLKAVYCYIQDAITAAQCSPAFEDVAAGSWYVDEDENETGVIGQEFCCGALLNGAAQTAASYGWVLVAGQNPTAMVTSSSSVAKGYGITAHTTDGEWAGVTATATLAATSGVAYNHIGYVPAVARADDSSNALAAGGAMFNSIWGGLPVTLEI